MVPEHGPDLQLKYILLCKECLKWFINRSDKSCILFKTYHQLGPLRHTIQCYHFPGINICYGLIIFTTLSVHIQHTWMMCECCNYALVIIQAMSGPINCSKIANIWSMSYHSHKTLVLHINYNTQLDSHSSTWTTVCQQDFQCSALVNCFSSLYIPYYAHQWFQ